MNLVMNYSPHLSPNTREAPQTVELRKILNMTAQDMLESFLRKCRKRRQVDGDASNKAANTAVDTVLAKIFAQECKKADLQTLLTEPNDVVLAEVEPVFRQHGLIQALCLLYKEHGDDGRLLETWSRLVEGDLYDEEVQDPLSQMLTLLKEKKEPPLIQKWGIWLTVRDAERGLQLLKSQDSRKRKAKPEDDLATLHQIQEASPEATAQYLEYLVLQKGNSLPYLHDQLASCCVDQLLASLTTDSVAKLWRAKASSYASSRNDMSFLSYFASTTPDSDHKRTRLKTALFLQASPTYDVGRIRGRLLEHQKVLQFELAILEGKLGNHKVALSILASELRDNVSAKDYCVFGGRVIPPKLALSIAEKAGIPQQWAAPPLSPSEAKSKAVAASLAQAKSESVGDGLKRDLVKILLEVYMSDDSDRAAQLLNTQASVLDAIDVIELIPPAWPMSSISSFLTKSFRRTLHTMHEGQIVKMISAGQNLEVKDRAWLILREDGAMIEEADSDADPDAGDVEGGGSSFDEKGSFAEKIEAEMLAREPPHVIAIDDPQHKQEPNWAPDGSSAVT
ncbi:hypothetical protein HGRIS_011474 [Hohenbuehelia grisea]|uniref:Vacuolar sorting protein 39/Transforming growth factor beta receptor-associated domain-containing protein n=1 Tax=Hohenbuehelia grisea TaxID=104357 RepID=A0ABR3JXE6_9AGAR